MAIRHFLPCSGSGAGRAPVVHTPSASTRSTMASRSLSTASQMRSCALCWMRNSCAGVSLRRVYRPCDSRPARSPSWRTWLRKASCWSWGMRWAICQPVWNASCPLSTAATSSGMPCIRMVWASETRPPSTSGISSALQAARCDLKLPSMVSRAAWMILLTWARFIFCFGICLSPLIVSL
jgi:hypothetical protein